MIEVDHLSKTYGTTAAIQDVTFSVEPGEILGFLGPNGAGKTTTMRILTGYLPASSGTARVAGFDVHEHSMEVRRHIGYLPETPPLYTDMTVEGFLYFVARLKGVAVGDRATQVSSALHRCNLEEKRTVLIRKLSKGFRQRVGLAQAIVHDPPVIILDEPTVGLDPRQIIDVRNLIKSLAGDHTIILSTHILPEVSMTCNRVAIINQGRVVATNSPDQLMEQLIGGSGYELEIEGPFAVAEAALRELPEVKVVEAIARPNLDEGYCLLRVITEGSTDLGRQISAKVVGRGLGLYEMRRVKVSLEDVFLELTTEEHALDDAMTELEKTAGVDAAGDPIGEPAETVTRDPLGDSAAPLSSAPREDSDPSSSDAA
ncbi:MAG: ABC transporter ATP-binding protein [Kaiparowitsia implicata GSE-PSE-MK54-09C]|jgi:ABC-2 type transport system ATP-binding protein|nr:ABC transporter ATP-binding protein [Kaiparowitsia implicata GSE-PSE-MK54-09C]